MYIQATSVVVSLGSKLSELYGFEILYCETQIHNQDTSVSVGASSCNSGDGTDQRVQYLMFMMMMMMMILQ